MIESAENIVAENIPSENIAPQSIASESIASERLASERIAAERLVQRTVRLRPNPPRVLPVLPTLPAAPTPQKFPIAAVISSLVIGGASFMITGSPLSFLFLGMTPLLLLGQNIGTKIATIFWSKSTLNAELERFRHDLAEVLKQERRYRESTSPKPAEYLSALRQRTALLWSAEPEIAPPSSAIGQDLNTQIQVTIGRAESSSEIANTLNHEFAGKLKELGWDSKARLRAKKFNRLITALEEDISGSLLLSAVPFDWTFESGQHYGIVTGPLAVHNENIAALVLQLALKYSPAVLQLSHCGKVSELKNIIEHLPHSRIIHGVDTDTAPNSASSDANVTWNQKGFQLVIIEHPSLSERAELLEGFRMSQETTVLWLTHYPEQLPPQSAQFLALNTHAATLVTIEGHDILPLQYPVRLSIGQALRIAEELSPLVDADTVIKTKERFPSAIALSDFHPQLDLHLQQEIWKTSTGRDDLAIIIGDGEAEEFRLDIVTDGPHALIAGTTGSGKSEFLQAWLLALARQFSPEQVNFFLIDFKGGASFLPFVALPHQVGLVTDISDGSVRRVFLSLHAELRYREKLFAEVHAQKLSEYRGLTSKPLPRLLIVIDEFAALLQEHPELAEVFISLAQRGRSLGIHLIMSTQRPSGVVPASLAANLGLRIAFRTADSLESQLIIDSDAAALIPVTAPGRAVVQRSQNNRQVIQMASIARSDDQRKTVLNQWIETIVFAAEQLGIPKPRKPWLEPLPSTLRLGDIDIAETETDAEKNIKTEFFGNADIRNRSGTVIGLIDDPAHQRQYPLELIPKLHGNLTLIGGAGSGKSTGLITMSHSLRQQGYAVSFWPEDETQFLDTLMTPTENTVLMLDGFERFRDRFEFNFELSKYYQALIDWLGNGRQTNRYVVLTLGRLGALPSQLQSTIRTELYLGQHPDQPRPRPQASLISALVDESLASGPGRGWLQAGGFLEFQLAHGEEPPENTEEPPESIIES